MNWNPSNWQKEKNRNGFCQPPELRLTERPRPLILHPQGCWLTERLLCQRW